MESDSESVRIVEYAQASEVPGMFSVFSTVAIALCLE